MKQFTYKKVADYFKESEDYRTRKGIIHGKEDPVMIDFICNHASSEDKIPEVGGAAVLFLILSLKIQALKRRITWNSFMMSTGSRLMDVFA
jgi:hypothetical protein